MWRVLGTNECILMTIFEQMKPLHFQTMGRTEYDMNWAKQTRSNKDIVHEGIPVGLVAILLGF